MAKQNSGGGSTALILIVVLLIFIVFVGIGYLVYSSMSDVTDEVTKKKEKASSDDEDGNGKNTDGSGSGSGSGSGNGNGNGNGSGNSTSPDNTTPPPAAPTTDIFTKFDKKENTKLVSERSVKTKRFDTVQDALKYCDENMSCSGITFSKDIDITKDALYEIHEYKKLSTSFDTKKLSYRKKNVQDLSSNYDKITETVPVNSLSKGAYEQNYSSLQEALLACMLDDSCYGVTQIDPEEEKFLMQSYQLRGTESNWEATEDAVTYTKTAQNQKEPEILKNFNSIRNDHGFCLDYVPTSSVPATEQYINVKECVYGAESQNFYYDETKQTFVHRPTGLVTDVSGSKTEKGTRIIAYASHGGDNQKFTKDGTTKRFKNVKSSKCMDHAGNAAVASYIQIWDCGTQTGQKWEQK